VSDDSPAGHALAGLDIALRDGRPVHLRALGPSDEAEILQAFQRLSDDARYMRFMRVVRTPDPERLRAVLASFPERGIGIVSTVPAGDGIDIVGSAIAVFTADRPNCEFAITVASEYGGSGLGLAIVDAITKAHGGRCVVTDTDGGGATFTIHLPLPNTELPRPVRAGDVVLQREAAG